MRGEGFCQFEAGSGRTGGLSQSSLALGCMGQGKGQTEGSFPGSWSPPDRGHADLSFLTKATEPPGKTPLRGGGAPRVLGPSCLPLSSCRPPPVPGAHPTQLGCVTPPPPGDPALGPRTQHRGGWGQKEERREIGVPPGPTLGLLGSCEEEGRGADGCHTSVLRLPAPSCAGMKSRPCQRQDPGSLRLRPGVLGQEGRQGRP